MGIEWGEHRITDMAPYGRHIPLVCKCGNRFHTKNIGWIGARTVFVIDEDCPCPIAELTVNLPLEGESK